MLYEEAIEHFDHLYGRIKMATDRANLDLTPDLVFDHLSERTMQAWVILEDDDIAGIICTKVDGGTCAMPIVQSDNMAEHLPEVLDCIEAWARHIDCERLEGVGRDGWERALRSKGFEKRATIVVKELD